MFLIDRFILRAVMVLILFFSAQALLADFAAADKINAKEESCADNPGECTILKNPLGDNPEDKNIVIIIGKTIKEIIAFVGSLTLLVFVAGGVMWLTSAGNPEKVKKGTNTMVYAVIGLFVIFAAYAILNTIIKGLQG